MIDAHQASAQAFSRAVAFMVASTALLTVNDAATKWLVATLPVGQIMAARGLVMILGLVIWLGLRGRLADLRVRDWRGQSLRALLFAGSMACFVASLRFLPLADAIAITFASPLFTTLLAMPLLRETVGLRRSLAIVVGFAGVLLIVQPTGRAVAWAGLLPLGAALAVGIMDILTRRLAATETSLSLLFTMTLAATLAGLATLPFGWPLPTAPQLGLLLLAAVTQGGCLYLQIECFRLAEASSISPYRYSQLIWAVVAGYLLWGTLPSGAAWLGAALIVASAVYIWHRERSRRRERNPAVDSG